MLTWVKRRMRGGWTFAEVATSMLLVSRRTLSRWLREELPIPPAATRYMAMYDAAKRRKSKAAR